MKEIGRPPHHCLPSLHPLAPRLPSLAALLPKQPPRKRPPCFHSSLSASSASMAVLAIFGERSSEALESKEKMASQTHLHSSHTAHTARAWFEIRPCFVKKWYKNIFFNIYKRDISTMLYNK
ncbi:hypothetical protein AAHE18_14G096700 [Arachis hypogaea]